MPFVRRKFILVGDAGRETTPEIARVHVPVARKGRAEKRVVSDGGALEWFVG
jgi:hypothetical protein